MRETDDGLGIDGVMPTSKATAESPAAKAINAQLEQSGYAGAASRGDCRANSWRGTLAENVLFGYCGLWKCEVTNNTSWVGYPEFSVVAAVYDRRFWQSCFRSAATVIDRRYNCICSPFRIDHDGAGLARGDRTSRARGRS